MVKKIIDKILRFSILSLVLGAFAFHFSSCIKEDYFQYGNKINLISPFIDFKDENPGLLPFPVFRMGANGITRQSECEFLLIGNDGTEYSLGFFNSGNGVFDALVEIPLDWSEYRYEVNPGAKHTFRAIISYLTEDAYTTVYNEFTGEYENYLVDNYFDFLETKSIEMRAKLEPNRIYEMDMLAETLEDLGVYIEETTNNNGGGNGDCDMANYIGPEFNVQIDSQCKTAYLYDCAKRYDERDVACALYYSWDDGSPDFPDCPYCK